MIHKRTWRLGRCAVQHLCVTFVLHLMKLSTRMVWCSLNASLVAFRQARSVILATIADIHYLFVGLGDGHVVSFPLEVSAESNITLGTAKKVAVGTQPIGLACFRNNGMVCVFVASDRPAVIYCSGGKLLYANVNMGEVGSATRYSAFMQFGVITKCGRVIVTTDSAIIWSASLSHRSSAGELGMLVRFQSTPPLSCAGQRKQPNDRHHRRHPKASYTGTQVIFLYERVFFVSLSSRPIFSDSAFPGYMNSWVSILDLEQRVANEQLLMES